MLPSSRSPRYGPCSFCGALNMAHRLNCYRCRRPLQMRLAASEAGTRTGPPLTFMPRGNARRYPRQEVYLDNVEVEGDWIIRHRVLVRNIGIGGLQFRTLYQCPIGKMIRIYLPLGGQTFTLEGMVRYRRLVVEKNGAMQAHGVEFQAISPHLHRLLNRLV